MHALDDLRNAHREALERLLIDQTMGPLPTGHFKGQFLCWLDTPGSKRVVVRVAGTLGFRWLRWGIDFEHHSWRFTRWGLRVGAFRTEVGPSRWRETEVVALRYDVSRLPRPFPRLLYDEIKPLSADLCLGIGGLNAERGSGDHFSFALSRQ